MHVLLSLRWSGWDQLGRELVSLSPPRSRRATPLLQPYGSERGDDARDFGGTFVETACNESCSDDRRSEVTGGECEPWDSTTHPCGSAFVGFKYDGFDLCSRA